MEFDVKREGVGWGEGGEGKGAIKRQRFSTRLGAFAPLGRGFLNKHTSELTLAGKIDNPQSAFN